MHFKEMDPEILHELIKDEKDILTPLVQADEEIYKDAICPWCHNTSCEKAFEWRMALANDRPIPRYNLRCTMCKCLFSPFSGMVLEVGNIARREKGYEG